MMKNFPVADLGSKIAYYSLAAAACVFVGMLLLTSLHP
jgi:hypothetical protein